MCSIIIVPHLSQKPIPFDFQLQVTPQPDALATSHSKRSATTHQPKISKNIAVPAFRKRLSGRSISHISFLFHDHFHNFYCLRQKNKYEPRTLPAP